MKFSFSNDSSEQELYSINTLTHKHPIKINIELAFEDG